MDTFLQQSGWWLGHGGAVLLCLAGILISLFSISGSWLISLAAALLMWCRGDGTVTWWLIGAFLVLSALLELFDFFAGSLGISRRGGSASAGWAALAGGLIGMIAGTFIPIPVIGSLLGMCIGSFAFAFAVERRRLQHDAAAAHIAWGAVWARLSVTLIKTIAALGMTGYLWYVILSAA